MRKKTRSSQVIVATEIPAAGNDSPSTAARPSWLPEGFDVESWTRAACDASRVPFAVEDPVVLAKLRDLAWNPA
jgi:hypothetical protein